MNKKQILLIIIFFVSLIGLGLTNKDDEKAEEEHYQYMVCNGYWGDYKELNPRCEGIVKNEQ